MHDRPERQIDADIVVVGAGILGVCIAYWISKLYDCKIGLLDKEGSVAAHESTRNTGVLHRPFYLDPRKKRTFARAASISYPMWKELAADAGLPWLPLGTLSVAVDENQVRTLERYVEWSAENGMGSDEIALLDAGEAKALEPEVSCHAAFLSRTDVSVDFGRFTHHLASMAEAEGTRFMGGLEVRGMSLVGDKVNMSFNHGGRTGLQCRLLVNAAGGGALEIAHREGLGKEYAALNFRGDYWIVDEPFASRVGRNVYTPPRVPEFPFLDPHFVVRPGGTRQIGPNAALVSGPYAYRGFGVSGAGSLFESPLGPKLGLLFDRTFLSMVAAEWRSSLSKSAMCSRVSKFLPGLEPRMLIRRGISGVRSNIVGREGFVPEAVVLEDSRSVHILNYNSPGATGAPAFAAMLVRRMRDAGRFEGLTKKPENQQSAWSFDRASDFD